MMYFFIAIFAKKKQCSHVRDEIGTENRRLIDCACDEDNDFIVTGDTAGCMKLWDISKHRFRVDLTSEKMKPLWFI